MLQRLYKPAFAITVLTVLAIGLGQLASPATPDLPAIGLITTAAAPLLFLLHVRLAPPSERRHPVMVSATMGLGCAVIMIGVQRFGDDHQWLLGLALITLCAWMLYQRYVWRAGAPADQQE